MCLLYAHGNRRISNVGEGQRQAHLHRTLEELAAPKHRCLTHSASILLLFWAKYGCKEASVRSEEAAILRRVVLLPSELVAI